MRCPKCHRDGFEELQVVDNVGVMCEDCVWKIDEEEGKKE